MSFQPYARAETSDLAPWDRACAQIVAAGQRLDQRGWVPATAGNISVRLPDGRIAITRSGGHKGFLTPASVMEVGLSGAAVIAGDRPSAETLLHTQLYAHDRSIGAVLHGHSVAATVLSAMSPDADIVFAGYEVQKVFAGQTTHDAQVTLKLFDNDQDIARLATRVEPFLDTMPAGYLIRGHGVYVWGADMFQALARLEGLEFLLACALERRKLEAAEARA